MTDSIHLSITLSDIGVSERWAYPAVQVTSIMGVAARGVKYVVSIHTEEKSINIFKNLQGQNMK